MEKKYGSLKLRRKVRCICPLCEKNYHSWLFWTGTEPARVFCLHCKAKPLPDEEYSLDIKGDHTVLEVDITKGFKGGY